MTSPAHTLVLLDWNGTVMDDLDRAVTATNDATSEYGVPKMDRLAFQGSFTLPMKTWLLGLGISDADTGDVEKRWNVSMEGTAPVRENVAETLHRLRHRGVLTGVVTAANEAVIMHDISRNGLEGVFNRIHSSVGDKAECLTSLRHLGHRAYYMGDTAYDMECARQAGYTSISISDGFQRPDLLAAAGADHHLDGFGELVGLLDLPSAE